MTLDFDQDFFSWSLAFVLLFKSLSSNDIELPSHQNHGIIINNVIFAIWGDIINHTEEKSLTTSLSWWRLYMVDIFTWDQNLPQTGILTMQMQFRLWAFWPKIEGGNQEKWYKNDLSQESESGRTDHIKQTGGGEQIRSWTWQTHILAACV